ncbi:MAG: chemotaxis protein CheA [Thermodesulfobacteriota bacterium]
MSDMDLTLLTEEEIALLRETFFQQTSEIMESLQQEVLSLEHGGDRSEAVRNIKRHFHTLKGDSATIGLLSVSRVVHKMEDLMGRLERRSAHGSIDIDSDVIDLILKCVDEVAASIEKYRLSGDDTVPAYLEKMIDRVVGDISFVGAAYNIELNSSDKEKVSIAESEGKLIYRALFTFEPECAMKGAGALILERQILDVGEIIKSVPHFESGEIETAGRIECVMASASPIEEIKAWCYVPGVTSEVNIEPYETEGKLLRHKQLGVSGEEEHFHDAPAQVKGGGTHAEHGSGAQTIRVVSEKIDQIMDLVGELVMGRSTMSRLVSDLEARYPREELVGDFQLANAFVERSLSELQRSVMSVRMVPVGRVFKRFPRMVRDIGRTSGKEIRLDMRGEDTEIDKALVDMIGEPLLHILRNAVDHGIEMPSEREAAGKSRYGTVVVEAYHQGSEIVIEVSDDGCGIDAGHLKDKAIEKGFITSEEAGRMDEREALTLIYHSGFSTASVISDISGRGIGMDIVRSVVEGMRGSIRIKTAAGAGTSFIIRFPLTLAIIRAIIFRIGSRLFALPLGAVGEIIRIFDSNIERVGGREVVRYRNKVLSLLRLHDAVGGAAMQSPVTDEGIGQEKRSAKSFVMVVSSGEAEVGMVVDALVGEDELVVKAVDGSFMSSELVSGAAILGDGKVVLILNAFGIIGHGRKDQISNVKNQS